ncbi:DsbA family protein [Haladaptatus caseinilyticus]|uniref:DsbA family protein n=1 Tax=Haladaptatus caseinilyticus TaxID=2993314 RepID=UPI00224A5114|nr:thioredoxin domain-containing protein [Haladaptatus caseinilyticus]
MSERNSSRREFLKTVGIVTAAGLSSTIPASAANVTDAPIPDTTDDLTYATMGTAKDNPTAVVYGNFKCPYTQKFVQDGNLEAVINEYVTTGDLNVQFRALAYQPPGTTSHGSSTYYISDSDPLISEAAMGVWDVSPDDYWNFFDFMFSDLISGNVSFSEMENRMQSADVSDRNEIVDRASSDNYTESVEQSRYSAGDYDVSFTPTMVLNGETYAPHHDTDDLLSWIGKRISSASEPTDTESTSGDDSEPSSEQGTNESTSTDSSSNEENKPSESPDRSTSDESNTTDNDSSSSDTSESTSVSGSQKSNEDQSENISPSKETTSDSTTSSSKEDKEDDKQSGDESESDTDSTGFQSISIGDYCRIVLR